MFYEAYVLGSVLVTSILKTQVLNATNATPPFDYEATCGANNCPSFRLPQSSTEPSTSSVYWLLAALIAICLFAIAITVVFMDNLKSTNFTKDTDQAPVEAAEHKLTLKRVGRLLDEWVCC